MADKVVKIDIRVRADESARELAKISNSVASMNKNLKKTSDILGFFQNLTSSLAGASIFGFGVREITTMADSMLLLTSRISVFVGEGQKTVDTMKALVEISTVTKASIQDTAEVFSRIITATQRLNLGVDAQLGLTRVLQQSYRVSGSTATEAAASTLQFAQALSFGQLRGQELRSVLSQNSTLAAIFSKAIEGSGKDIYKFAEAGGFTTKFVLKALAENFRDIETKAGKLSQTFGQTLTLAMNRVTLGIDNLNQKFGLNEKFANFVDYILNNSALIITFFVTLGTFALPAVATGIKAITVALAANPIGLLVIGLSYGAAKLYAFTEEYEGAANKIKRITAELKINFLNYFALINPIWAINLKYGTLFKREIEKLKQSGLKDLKELEEARNKAKGINTKFIGPPKDLIDPVNVQIQALLDAEKRLKVQTKATIEEMIGALNVQFNKGRIGVEEYNKKLTDLTKIQLSEKLAKGTISVEKFNEEMRDLSLENYARSLEAGAISMEQFNNAAKQMEIDRLNDKFKRARISAAQFHQEMLKFSDPSLQDIFSGKNKDGLMGGLTSYVESLGTTSMQISEVVKNSFKGMEDAIYQAVAKGKYDFSDLTQSILDDMTRLVIRMQIIRPLVNAFTAYMGGGGSNNFNENSIQGSKMAGYANGGAFNKGVQYFSHGGVVSSPTMFGMAGGLGVMGEAGPEAIMPLSRGANGKLGVQANQAPVVVNVINQSGAGVETRERTGPGGSKIIEVLVKNIVKEGIQKGEFDKTMTSSFGLRRRGES